MNITVYLASSTGNDPKQMIAKGFSSAEKQQGVYSKFASRLFVKLKQAAT